VGPAGPTGPAGKDGEITTTAVTPVNDNDLANKKYVDDAIAAAIAALP
jgi:hypothetical protein